MSTTWGQHVVTMLYDVTLFQNLLLPSPLSRDQSCDLAINLWLMWQRDQSTLTRAVLKIEKWKEKKSKEKIKMKRENKIESTVNDLDKNVYIMLHDIIPSRVFYSFLLWHMICDSVMLHWILTLDLKYKIKRK